jgi:hypothetical protein
MATIPIPGVNTPTYQSWGAAVANDLNRFNIVDRTGTTNAYGEVQAVTPAQAGFTTITGAVSAATSTSPSQYTRCGQFFDSGGVWLLVEFWNGAAWVAYASKSIKIHTVVWGTGPI